jgi:protein-tyrosine phosphatase
MIDFHTHILPGIDDGARDVSTSVRMTEMMIEQHVDVVTATPHYYCLDATPRVHCENALKAYETLKSAWKETHPEGPDMPEIRTGAEIYLANSLESVPEPELLKISGTDLMLFEMPFSGYHEWIPRLTEMIAGKAGARPVFAHIDRYLDLYGRRVTDELEALPHVAFQFNTDSFEDRDALKYMYSLIKRGYTIFWASDCHGAHHRVPDMGNTLPGLQKKIEKKFSPAVYEAITKRQYALLGK